LDFFAPIDKFFHPPSLVLDLKSYVLIQNPTLKHYFLIKVFGFIKNNITIDDNILAYRVVQFIRLNIFTIADEYVHFTPLKSNFVLAYLAHEQMQHNQKHANDFAHQTFFDFMLEIALVGM
jgi:hypothetical protein